MADSERDTATYFLFEAGFFGRDTVAAGRQGRDRVLAAIVAHDDAREAGIQVLDGKLCLRQKAAVCIGDTAI